jgi:hypothetical protein
VIEVNVDEVLARSRASMAKKVWLDAFQKQRFAQEGIGVKIDLSNREIVSSAPARMNLAQLRWRERLRRS